MQRKGVGFFAVISLLFIANIFPNSAEEVKSHPFFAGIDWNQVYIQKYTPPLIPPRGEVNAADAFDIGSFDEEDTKGIKLTDADQELYRNFSLTISERYFLLLKKIAYFLVLIIILFSTDGSKKFRRQFLKL